MPDPGRHPDPAPRVPAEATPAPRLTVAPDPPAPGDAAWLARFHAGDRGVLEHIYRQHFERIDAAIGTVLAGANRETVVHDVFLRLVREEAFRRSFRGGNLGGWLATVARNQAIDYGRHRNRETPAGSDLQTSVGNGDALARSTEARLLIERFLHDVLPPDWLDVFQARFIDHLSQAEAAARLGKRRTTLAYQELRIRRLLRKFLLEQA